MSAFVYGNLPHLLILFSFSFRSLSLSVSPSLSLSMSPSLSLSMSPSLYSSMSVCLSVSLYLYLSLSLSYTLSLSLSLSYTLSLSSQNPFISRFKFYVSYLLSARPRRIQIFSKIKIVEFPSQTHFTIIFSNFNSKCDGVFVNDVIKIGWRGGGGGSGNNFCNTMYKGVSKTTILLRQWGRGPGVGWWVQNFVVLVREGLDVW